MTELFLLGAGASVDAGIPDAYKMARDMLAKITDDPMASYERIDKLLQFVVGGLLFQQGVRGENPYDGVNIEDLFNAILLLGDRHRSELGSFISAWHPQLVGLERGRLADYKGQQLLKTIIEPIEHYMKEVSKDLTESILAEVENALGGHSFSHFRNKKIAPFFNTSGFESSFSDAVTEVVTGSDTEGELFKLAAEAMILKLVEMVWITESSKVDYLIPLVQYAKATSSSIATLNYDNAIELAGQSADIRIDTGFDSWSSSGDFSFKDGEIPLLKLHGSIDWALSNGRVSEEKPLPFQVIRKVDLNLAEERNLHPEIIFGGKNKLTARGPYLSLLRSFEQRLSMSEILTIIGYSFRDEHVNQFIVNWFNGDVARSIRMINYNLDPSRNEFVDRILSGHAENRVQVINEKAIIGIPNLLKMK